MKLATDCVSALWQHKRRMLAEGQVGTETVFVDTQGGYLRKSNFRRRVWFPLLRRAGLPRKRMHDLRHTHASLLCEAGTHPKVIQARLGHSKIGMTLDTYSHLMPEMDETAAEDIGRLLA